jgi:hypothetical protein
VGEEEGGGGGRDAAGGGVRALKKIRYSEAELAAGVAPASSALPPPPPPPPAGDDRKAALMALIKEVPVEREAVYAFPIDWGALSSPACTARLSAWVGAKAAALLGSPEPSFVEGVMSLLASRTPATAAEAELGGVLDEDAPDFVLKLYRTVILEALKARRGL